MRFYSLINRLITYPNTSNINIQLSAIMMHGTKPVGNVCTNIERNYIKGHICPAMHAETNAIISYFGKKIHYSEKYGWILNKKVEKNLNIMVIRKKNDNTLGNARPCYKCTLMMQNIGINKVYYSMDNTIYCEKVRSMISVNVSPSWKQMEIINYANINNYIRSMINKMPKIIKATNAEYFLKHITNEINNCNYELTSDYLKMYSNNILLFKINIE
jgi:deoxycytidylate deaminase